MSSSVKNIGGDGNGASFDLIQNRIESLSGKMDKLINIQEKVLNRLDSMSQDIDVIEMDMENLKVEKEEIHMPPKMGNQTQFMGREVRKICQEMSTIMLVVNQRSEQQTQKLEGMEKLVLSMQQVISFIGETVKNSRVMELISHGAAAQKGSKPKDSKSKQAVKRRSSTDTINKKLDKVRLRAWSVTPKLKNIFWLFIYFGWSRFWIHLTSNVIWIKGLICLPVCMAMQSQTIHHEGHLVLSYCCKRCYICSLLTLISQLSHISCSSCCCWHHMWNWS